VAGTETKLACINQASFFNVPMDYFQNKFLEWLACFRQQANRTNFEGILGLYRVTSFPSKALENCTAKGSD
jgi:hypothetical protein